MEIFLIMGIIIGCGLYVSKIAFMHLLLPKILLDKIHRSPLAGAILDVVMGFMSIHIALLAGGSLVAMISVVTFGCCSMIYIYSFLQISKYRRWRIRKQNFA